MNRLDFIKMRNFCAEKNTTENTEIQITDREINICKSYFCQKTDMHNT